MANRTIMLKDYFYNVLFPAFDNLMLVGTYGDCYEIHENPTKELVENIMELHNKQKENNPYISVGGYLCLYDKNATKAIRFSENCAGAIVVEELSGNIIAKKECDFYM